MKLNLVGDDVLQRVDMALYMVRERYGCEPDSVIVTIKINGEKVVIDGEKMLIQDQEIANPRERHHYWNGFLFKQLCGSQRK